MDLNDRLHQKYPLAISVDIEPGRKLLYDSRSNLLFTLTEEQLEQLVAEEDPYDSQTLQMLECLRLRDVLIPGGRSTLFDATQSNIDSVLDYNAANIMMRKYVLEVTQDCNFRCSYCSNTIETQWRHHSHRHMSAEVACKAVDYYFKLYTEFIQKVPEAYRADFIKRNPPTLGYYGGEPTLNFKAIKEATDYMLSLPWEKVGVNKDDIEFTSNTNLSFMNEAMLEFFVSHSFMLFASLDGPASEHDKNRVDVHGGPTFSRAYKNLMKIRDYDPEYFKQKVTVMAVEAPNYDSRATHEFLDGLGCHISYLPMSTYGCFIANPVEKLKELEEIEDKLVERAVENFEKDPDGELKSYTHITGHRLNMKDSNPNSGLLPTCPVATDNIMIDVDGNFHICHKTDGSFVLGNVDEGLNRDALRKFYADLAQTSDCEACRNCWAVRSCGQCAAVRLRGGAFVNPNEDECRYIRKTALIDYEIFAKLYQRHPDIIDRLDEFMNDPDRYQGVIDLSTIKWENYRQQSGS